MYYMFSVCGCRLRYPAYNAHAPYCLLWRAWLYYIFHIISQTAPKKKLLNVKCVFRFSLQHLSETFFFLGWTERDTFKNVYWSSCKISLILILFQRNFNFLHRFFKYNHMSNFMIIHPVSRVVPYRHTDGRTDRQAWRTWHSLSTIL